MVRVWWVAGGVASGEWSAVWWMTDLAEYCGGSGGGKMCGGAGTSQRVSLAGTRQNSSTGSDLVDPAPPCDIPGPVGSLSLRIRRLGMGCPGAPTGPLPPCMESGDMAARGKSGGVDHPGWGGGIGPGGGRGGSTGPEAISM